MEGLSPFQTPCEEGKSPHEAARLPRQWISHAAGVQRALNFITLAVAQRPACTHWFNVCSLSGFAS